MATTPASQVALAHDPKFLNRLQYLLCQQAIVVKNESLITSSSVAAASVITMANPHGFTTGDSVTIAGHVGSTPSVNGTYVVTVLTSTQFSIPLVVTIAGSGGTAVKASHAARATYAGQVLADPAGKATTAAITIGGATNLTTANTSIDFNGIVTTDATDAAILSQIATLWDALSGVL